MNNVLEHLYRKRFGLSKEEDLDTKNLKCCGCGTQFYHICCSFTGRFDKIRILSFGENKYNPSTHIDSIKSSVHAEQNCVNKLPFTRKNKRINLLIVRFTKHYELSMSKPCQNCVNCMKTTYPKKGYIVKDVYYSTSNGEIVKTNLSRL